MPKRTDIRKHPDHRRRPDRHRPGLRVRLLGAQACKALREEGYRVILVNSNPATIMTDPEMADAIYIEPVNWRTVARIIEKEQPDALLPTMGGQTALNMRARPGARGRAGEIRRRADRRLARGHRHGRGPRAVPQRDAARSASRRRASQIAHSMEEALAVAGRASASRSSSGRRSPGRQRRRHRLQPRGVRGPSSRAASMPRRPARCCSRSR